MSFRCSLAFVLVLLGFRVLCAAQFHKVSSENIMDAAEDMRRAAEQADKLAPLGTKYCGWEMSSLDTSDLDSAISRFLLNHGSTVPSTVTASKMWRVSMVVGDMAHQLAMGESMCALNIRYSESARTVFGSVSSLLKKLMMTRLNFDELAYKQTFWEEEGVSRQPTGTEDTNEVQEGDVLEVISATVLSGALEIKDSAAIAAKVGTGAANTKGCLQTTAESLYLSNLDKLIGNLERSSRLPAHIRATNMWDVVLEAPAAQIDILSRLEACSPYAAEKKKVRNVAAELLDAYRRLTKAISAFYVLALQQTEWEEMDAKQQYGVEEQ